MTGLVIWDAVVWLVLGVLAGWTVTRWTNLRMALALVVLITLGAMLAVAIAALSGTEGAAMVATAQALLFSMPATAGIALGGLVAHLLRPKA